MHPPLFLMSAWPDVTLPLPLALLAGALAAIGLPWAVGHARRAEAGGRALALANAALTRHQRELEDSRRGLEDGAQTLSAVNDLLSRASGRFQELFQGLPVACVCCDREGRVMEWNRAWAHLFGVEGGGADSPLGRAPAAMRPDAPALLEAIAAALAGESREGVEWGHVRPDGSPVRVRSSLFPLRGEDGSVVGLIGADADVTVQHETEEALRRSEERLHALYNVTSRQELTFAQKTEALLEMGRAQFGLEIGVVARVSGDVYEVRQALSPGDVIPRGKTMAVCGTYCAEALALADAVSFESPDTPARRDSPAHREHGLEAYLGTPIRVGGEVWGMLCFAGRQPSPRLFTTGDRELVRLMAQWVGGELARQEAEAAVRASEARFRTALAAMSEGLIVMDAAGVIRLWNESAEKILGVTRGHVGGWLPPHPDFAAVREDGTSFPEGSYPLVASLRRGEVQTAVVTGLPGENGAMRWVSVSSRPLPPDPGGRAGVVATFSDITDRRRDEAQIQAQMAQIKDYTVVLEHQQARMAEANAELERLALSDGLTGLGNRRAFEQRVALEISRAVRYDHPLSLLLLDVDRFKEYNDTFGHVAGDEVLRLLASALRAQSRETDFYARYGGEEFAVVLPHTDGAGALVVAERLRARLENIPWPRRPVTASFGAATLLPAMESADDLVRDADAALYAAKDSGRNAAVHAHVLSPLPA